MASVYIYGPIKEGDAREVVSEINAAKGSLDVHINSPGGSVYEGLAIFNALQSKKEILTTYIDGLAYSAASWLPFAAKKENRYMSPASQFGIHEAVNFAGGNKQDLKAQIEHLKKIDEIQVWIYSENSDMTPEEVRALMHKGSVLSMDEALQFGFQPFQEKIAAYFNIDNMDLFEKMASIFDPNKESKIIKEEAEKETQEALEKAEDVTAQFESQFAKKADFEALKKHFEPFIEAITAKWAELPTKKDLEDMVEAHAKLKVAELAASIKSKGIAPTADEMLSEAKAEEKPKSYEPLTMPEGVNLNELLKK